jgi:hypothetical protein
MVKKPLMPFIFIRNKRPVISSEGFFALEKNAVICLLRAVLPIQSVLTAGLQIVKANVTTRNRKEVVRKSRYS